MKRKRTNWYAHYIIVIITVTTVVQPTPNPEGSREIHALKRMQLFIYFSLDFRINAGYGKEMGKDAGFFLHKNVTAQCKVHTGLFRQRLFLLNCIVPGICGQFCTTPNSSLNCKDIREKQYKQLHCDHYRYGKFDQFGQGFLYPFY